MVLNYFLIGLIKFKMKLSKIAKNKIIFKNYYKKCFIIGSSPSKNARSPKLWNYVYKKLNMKREMYPVDL